MTEEPQGTPPLPSYQPASEADPEMRQRALKRIQARREFTVHLSVYAIIMVFLVAIWAVAGGGYFWPIWPMMGWGLGVALHAGSLRWDREPTEKEIAAEAQKIRRQLGRDIPQDD